jgi:CheY-like chemotaxis protein
VVEMDAFRVRQVLINLVGNALKFTPRGSVTLEVSWALGELSFSVNDTGPGLSSEQLGRLFVAFQQANTTDAARHGGTGLGLTISKELAQLMGGSIGVESTVGVGTCFKLTIPASLGVAKPPATSAESPAAPSGPKLMNGTVLIAEDADDLRALAVIFLKRFGLTVLQAKNGREAVDLAVQKKPDVILMDMEMPVLHGLEAVKELRSAGFGRPILAMTAHGGEPHRTLALAAGCNDVLAKPVSQANLRAALDSALSVSQKAAA